MDGRILGSLYVLVNAFIAGGTWLGSQAVRSVGRPEGYVYHRMEYSMIVSMSFWITVAILFHLDVFLRGERSWLRSWLSTPGGTGVLAFAVILNLIPSLLMVIVDFSQVREGQPFFGAGTAWIWLLQGAMLVVSSVALVSAISAFKERKPPRVYE